MLLSSAALVTALDSSGIFFQQAMQRPLCLVQCSINLQLGVCERLNGTDFHLSIHLRFLHNAYTRLRVSDVTK